MSILLTDEEILSIIREYEGTCQEARHEANRAQLKKVVERFETEFPKMVGLRAIDLPLTSLWKEIRKEAGL
ncbi:hypothetical protein LCGC14_1655120 [marine sediment metagenome]|uniref:Uncharacterized protein n=1 Tax=marine sediment metagenome TaxID=412755 RepID=A0A0F9II83_9ZZZZ